MAENLPDLEKETDAQLQDTEDAKQDESKQTHTKISKIKDKERILKAARKKRVICKGTPIRLLVDFVFLSEAL